MFFAKLRYLLVFPVFMSLLCFLPLLHASDSLIVFFDDNKVVQESLLGQSISSQIEKKQADYEKDLIAKFNLIKKEKERILQDFHSGLITNATHQSQMQKNDQAYNNWQMNYKTSQMIAHEAQRNYQEIFDKQISTVASSLAKENKYTLIIRKRFIVYSDNNIHPDITDMLIAELDKKIKGMKVEFTSHEEFNRRLQQGQGR